MASSGERRMVFDTRGRRKHVIRVVYAILAILMGASLFLVVGPVNIGALIGNQSSTSSAAKVLDEQAERIERRLAKDPTNEALLLSLTRARIGAGNAQIEVNSSTEVPTVTVEAKADFEAALQTWNRYLKQAGDEPNAPAAQLVAGSFFRLAESSASLREAEADVTTATDAQRIAVEQRPSLGSLSTLAIYQFFNSEFAAGDKTTKQAAAKAPSKAEGKNVEKQLAEYRKRGKQFEKKKKQLTKVEKEIGKEKLTNPFGGLGGSSTGTGSAGG
jgi:hypothetical protein